MRVLLKAEFGLEAANKLVREGALGRRIQAILEEQKPEAAYFTEFAGARTALLVLELAEAGQIPALAEPWFLGLGARVEFHPLMVPGDLQKAAPTIAAAGKKYG